MDLQSLQPQREHDAPMYLQLYRRYREAIASGKLRAGDRVPSVRSLASELNLARGTVELAYQMLTSEGYLLARGPAGTTVSPGLEHLMDPAAASESVPLSRTAHTPAAVVQARPFQLGLPALDEFPRKTWARLAGHNLRTLDMAVMTYPDPLGYGPLRHAIAAYLGVSRGIACTPEQVLVTPGYRGALALVCRALLQAGDTGWYEDPGYRFARQFMEHAGMHLSPVPVDRNGLNVAAGRQLAPQARFAMVTPTHQSPMGMALSLPRRLELLDWAAQQQAWIIEDDYDSEFRYQGRPLPALKSLDRDGRVLYTGTFSKVLFPGLQLAYLVVPPQLIERFQNAAQHLPGPGALLQQATVADFMQQGHFARHLRRMRTLYATRHGYLVDALLHTLGAALHVQPQAGGMQVLAYLHNTQQDDCPVAAAAQLQGLAVQALGCWRMQPAQPGGLLMGFTNLATAEQAQAACQKLKSAVHALLE